MSETKNENKIVMTTQLSAELHQKVSDKAAKEFRSRQSVMRQLISEHC